MDRKSIESEEKIRSLFTEIAKSITSSLEVHHALEAIMNQVQYYFEPRNWSLLRIDDETQELYFVIAKGMDPKIMKDIRLKVGEGIAGHVARTGKSIFVTDTKNDPLFSKKIDALSDFKTSSLIAVPMIFQNKVIGVIELINVFENRSFNQGDLELLETIAEFSAIALTNSLAYERISKLVVTDPLTGLFNRIHLDKVLNASTQLTLSNSQSGNSQVVAAWIDVDNFKQVNDQYGHHVGDEMLCKVAAYLKECCRETDYAFRVGGDEFLILIIDLTIDDIQSTVERLQSKLEAYSKKLSPFTGFSFGIAWGLHVMLQQIIIDSDRAMYKNKRLSKERTFL